MYSLTDLLIAALFFCVLILWWGAQGAKQLALMATRDYCEKMDVQLLDDVVALRGFWLKRDGHGSVRVWRSYNFEFTTTGDQRYRGRIILLGKRVEAIYLEPHRLN